MSESYRRYRQYAGLFLLIVVFVGGIVGWTYATLQVNAPTPPPADTTTSPQRTTVKERTTGVGIHGPHDDIPLPISDPHFIKVEGEKEGTVCLSTRLQRHL